MIKDTGIVYQITDSKNGKFYVGASTTTLNKRWNNHTSAARNGNEDWILYQAMRAVGLEHFSIKLLQEDVPLEELGDVERDWQYRMNSYYPHGYNDPEAPKTDFTKYARKAEKMSKALTGKRRSKEVRDRMRASHNNTTSTPIRIVETSEEFASITEAAKHLGVLNQAISPALRRGHKVKGYTLVPLKPLRSRPYASGHSPKAKPVICIDTGERFDSARQADRHFGLAYGSVHLAIGRGGTTGGYHFTYTSDSGEQEAAS